SGKTSVIVNEKPVDEYFKTKELVKVAMEALHKPKELKEYAVTVIVKGGGTHSQAEAVRHGIARALTKSDETLKTEIKKLGFLKKFDPFIVTDIALMVRNSNRHDSCFSVVKSARVEKFWSKQEGVLSAACTEKNSRLLGFLRPSSSFKDIGNHFVFLVPSAC